MKKIEKNYKLSETPEFTDFVRRRIIKDAIQKNIHFHTQVSAICLLKNKPSVDFIGYFENIENDFSIIQDRLKIKTSLKKLNVTPAKKQDYQSYYTEETKQIVSNVYADDINTFGYTFEGDFRRTPFYPKLSPHTG